MKIAAGIIIASKDTGRMLLAKRSDSHAWANFGGTLHDFETTYRCAIRELMEEAQFEHRVHYTILGTRAVHVMETPTITYYTYVAACENEPVPVLNDENIDYGWFALDELPNPMHFGMNESLGDRRVTRAIRKITP